MTISSLTQGRRASITGAPCAIRSMRALASPYKRPLADQQQTRTFWFWLRSSQFRDPEQAEEHDMRRRQRSMRHRRADALKRGNLWERDSFIEDQRRSRGHRWASSLDKPHRNQKLTSKKKEHAQEQQEAYELPDPQHEGADPLGDLIGQKVKTYRQMRDDWRRQLDENPYDAIFGFSNRMLKGYGWDTSPSFGDATGKTESREPIDDQKIKIGRSGSVKTEEISENDVYVYDPISMRKILKKPKVKPKRTESLPSHRDTEKPNPPTKERTILSSESRTHKDIHSGQQHNAAACPTFIQPSLDRLKLRPIVEEEQSERKQEKISDADLEDVDTLTASDIRESPKYRNRDLDESSRARLEEKYQSLHSRDAQVDSQILETLNLTKSTRPSSDGVTQDPLTLDIERISEDLGSSTASHGDGVHQTLSDYEESCLDSRSSPYAPKRLQAGADRHLEAQTKDRQPLEEPEPQLHSPSYVDPYESLEAYDEACLDARSSPSAPKAVRDLKDDTAVHNLMDLEKLDADRITPAEGIFTTNSYEEAPLEARRSRYAPKAVQEQPFDRTQAVPETAKTPDCSPYVSSEAYDEASKAARHSNYAPKGLANPDFRLNDVHQVFEAQRAQRETIHNTEDGLHPSLEQYEKLALGQSATAASTSDDEISVAKSTGKTSETHEYVLVTYHDSPGVRTKHHFMLHQELPALAYGSILSQLLETLGSNAHSINLDIKGCSLVSGGGNAVLYRKDPIGHQASYDYEAICCDESSSTIYPIQFQGEMQDTPPFQPEDAYRLFALDASRLEHLTGAGYSLHSSQWLRQSNIKILTFGKPSDLKPRQAPLLQRVVRLSARSGKVVGSRDIRANFGNDSVQVRSETFQRALYVCREPAGFLRLLKDMDRQGFRFRAFFSGSWEVSDESHEYAVFEQRPELGSEVAQSINSDIETEVIPGQRHNDVFTKPEALHDKTKAPNEMTLSNQPTNHTVATPPTPFPPLLVRRQESVFTGERSHTGKKHQKTQSQPSRASTLRKRLVRSLLLLQNILKTGLYGLVLVYVVGHVWANWRELETEKGKRVLKNTYKRSDENGRGPQ